MKDMRRKKMKEKMKEKMKRDSGDFFFLKNVSEPSNPPDELAQNVSKKKKSLSDELFLHFSFESSESDRVFNYLHDSNSIFRTRGINSEWVFRPHCMVADIDELENLDASEVHEKE